jgi:hypothetical protein
MLLTLVPYTMKEIVAREASGARTTGPRGLAAQEDVAALLAVRPPDTTEVAYVDLQAVANLLYDTAVPLLQTAVKPNLLGDEIPFELDWAQLPPARTVRRHFRSLAVFTSATTDGISIKVQGPVPVVALAAVAIGVGATFFLRAVSADAAEMRASSVRVGPRRIRVEGEVEVEGEDAPEVEMARLQAQELARYVRAFLFNHKRLPETLHELVEEKIALRIHDDPWGNPFFFGQVDGKPNGFLVGSMGPDGEIGTDDDILVDG